MIKFLINHPEKWQELELYKYLHSFGLTFDKKVFNQLNHPSTEAGFLRTLTPVEREIYYGLEAKFYNDDTELIDDVYLFAEEIMRGQTKELLLVSSNEIDNLDIFETLEKLSEGSNNILDTAKIEDENPFEDWEVELRKKVAGEITIINSNIIPNLPMLGGELTILAARPSMGKTAMALSILLEKSKDFKVHFISSEMTVGRIIDRLVSYATGVSTRRITTGQLLGYEVEAVIEAKNDLQNNSNILISYCESMRKIKRVISTSDAKLVMVDYLQLIKGEQRLERRLQIAEMSRDFKRISTAKNIPVILLAQINRATLQTEGKRPGLENLAESAAIEQDADNVVFIHRPPYYLSEDLKAELNEADLSETELIIAKQRDGLRGVEKCQFIAGRFVPVQTTGTASGTATGTAEGMDFRTDEYVPF